MAGAISGSVAARGGVVAPLTGCRRCGSLAVVPTFRNGIGSSEAVEGLVQTSISIETFRCAVVDHIAVVGGVARPGHVGGVGRDVGDAPGGEHRRGAVGQGGEGHLHVVDALVAGGAVGHYGERVLGVGGEAGDVEADGAGCGGAQLGAAVHDGVGLAGGVASVARPAYGGAVGGEVRGLGGRGLVAGGGCRNLHIVKEDGSLTVVGR